MGRLTRFRKAIHYMEQHLHGEISVAQAARAGFMSLMQLYRDCYAYTGHSVKEYIRKRRLSNALSLIRCLNIPLAEIAYSCGYSSQQALCKCVRSAVSMSPLEYRRSEAYYYFPRFDNTAPRQVTVSAETIPRIIWVRFYFPRLHGIEEQAIDALQNVLPGYKGRIFGRDGRQKDNRFCYQVAVEYDRAVLDKLRDSDFREAEVVPEIGLTCARTIVNNEENEIRQGWNDLYSGWLKTSMFTQDDADYFEEYVHKGGKIKRLILYLPVRKRTDYDKITLARCEDMVFLVSSSAGQDQEEQAARAVVSFLAAHKPEAIRTTRQFYVSRDAGVYTCGVRLDPVVEAEPAAGGGLEVLRAAAGSYAVLESGCCSDSQVLESLLDRWIGENGLRKDKQPAFFIYETDGSFQQDKIRTKCLIKLEDVKNG